MAEKMPDLSLEKLRVEAAKFAVIESSHYEESLYGTTDGKAVGTYFEHKFVYYLENFYSFQSGNSASGIDFPELNVDMKVTSIRQPQSSCPFRTASQKIYGLGYHLLIFVYEKTDCHEQKTGHLDISNTIFVEKEQTGDFQTTTGLLKLLENEPNIDDICAFLFERKLPVDEISAIELAERIIKSPPKRGYLTISNALQWRLQYGRAIQIAGEVDGIIRLN